MTKSKAETITVLPAQPAGAGLWSPVAGDHMEQLGAVLTRSGKLDSQESFRKVRSEAVRILEQCLKPASEPGRRTGLVIGYVQSGKTMSMTSVSALARDNGIRLIIVFAGTKKNLVAQSKSRFEKELRGDGDSMRWKMWPNPTLSSHRDDLANLVAEWRDPRIPEDDQRGLFITVMKQHQHLERLAELLEAVDLRGVTALVFDDEADQAGLNTQPDKDEASTTYRRIQRVRELLPRHTYLQYTATPQAPLLISIADMLSPDFSEVIRPGKGYTGGRAFFVDRTDLVRTIPPNETPEAVGESVAPPESLLEALRIYFLGVAAAHAERDRTRRSMLIHPSVRQASHSQYKRWVDAVKQRWRSLLEPRDGTDPEREAELSAFRAAYDSLKRSVGEMPTFQELQARLWTAIGRTVVTEVNSETGHEVDWDREMSHILVGGAKLERGFTVEGLTVTYMPRGPGGGNVDVIQQRARFFGYKERYLGYCRVYLPADVADSYRDYVRHEEHIREQVRAFRGRPLQEWRRAFYLNRSYRPTRANVLRDPYHFVAGRGGKWFKQATPHFSTEAVQRNRTLVEGFLGGLTLQPWARYGDVQVAAAVPLRRVVEQLLAQYAFLGARDSVQSYGYITRLMDHLESEADARCSVFLMAGGRDRKRQVRGDDDDSIELHQGRGSSGEESGYPGDERVCDPEAISLQVHWLRVEPRGSGGAIERVPALAIRLPASMGGLDVLVQEQGSARGS